MAEVITLRLDYTIPDLLYNKIEVSRPYQNYNSKGNPTSFGFEEEKQRDNEALENIKARYKEKDQKAIEEYCDLVLNSSQYPYYFPQNWVLEYREDSRIAVVEYDFPAPD